MSHTSSSDGTLVLLTLAGEAGAYDELVKRHEKRVRAAAYSVIRNAHIAEDAAQDAFLAAWLKLDRLIEPEKFGVWAARIAKNCAVNMAQRFRSYLSLEDISGLEFIPAEDYDPEKMLLSDEEARLLRRGLRKLPERAKQVVYLHYYEDMSAEDIAGLLGVSVGTVKSQLHDGRRKMRKELCAMDEKLSDTLLQKINKKIDEVKGWQYKNNKAGFEKVYESVLKDIDALPESREKYHALADVLMRGWWWLPGEKNDKLFERIKEAARLGKNNEVMSALLQREMWKYWGGGQLRHIKDVQIPSLDPVDFRLTIANRWLSYAVFAGIENPEKAREGFENAIKLLTPADGLQYHDAVQKRSCFEESTAEEFAGDIQNRESICRVLEIDLADGFKIREEGVCYILGGLFGCDRDASLLLNNLVRCDGMARADVRPCESFTASDGSTLTFEVADAAVTVPAGSFEGCEVWTSRLKSGTYRNTLKSGVGLIKQEIITEGVKETRVLADYHLTGGNGGVPFGIGSFWRYEADANPNAYISPTVIEVLARDGKNAIVALNARTVRRKYDENSWLDMILKTRCDYCTRDDDEQLQDVRAYAKRAVELAKTNCERVHAETAYSVVTRIIEGDPKLNPGSGNKGLWNFFVRNEVGKADGKLRLCDSSQRFSFEWKETDGTPLCDRVCSNHIYSILSDVAGCLFDEQWKDGFKAEKRTEFAGDILNVKIACADAGTVEVKAGSFENCLAVDTVCEGFGAGWEYRGGRRTYYFARGIGLVKVEMYSAVGEKSAYELTSYDGVGEGYMPMEDGIRRRYVDLGLTDGYVGASEYVCAVDCEGRTVLFSDLTGIRRQPTGITRYGSVAGEIEEGRLISLGKDEEADAEGSCNAIKMLLHQVLKGHRHSGERLAKRLCYNLRLIEAAGNGEVPPAFYARYSRICLLASAAFFGAGQKDDGYKYLELSLEYAEKWKAILNGERLSFGDEAVFGKVVFIKGKSAIELPDGTMRSLDAKDVLDGWLSDSGLIYLALNGNGWKGFDTVRDEKRYKSLTERAKRLAE